MVLPLIVMQMLNFWRVCVSVCVCSYLYWSDWGDVPHIGRIGMDGTDRSIIVKDKITWPNGLTLDFINDRIYWADAREDYIAFASLDGSNRHIGTESLFMSFCGEIYLSSPSLSPFFQLFISLSWFVIFCLPFSIFVLIFTLSNCLSRSICLPVHLFCLSTICPFFYLLFVYLFIYLSVSVYI